MPEITLDKLVPGESGRIIKITGKGAIRRRLVDMGFTSGAVVDVVKISPLGDPIEYRLRGYHLSLRASEAKMIMVDLIEHSQPARSGEPGSRSSLPLRMCKTGQAAVIVRTRGGRRLQSRMKDLGLVPGSKISVVRNDFPGPLIISLTDEDRIIIGKGMAMHILVKSGLSDPGD